MNKLTPVATPRAPRFSPFDGTLIQAQFDQQFGALKDLSASGIACKIKSDRPPVLCGTRIPELSLAPLGARQAWNCGPARVVRIEQPADGSGDDYLLGIAFEKPQPDLVASFQDVLIENEERFTLRSVFPTPSGAEPTTLTLDRFSDQADPDLFAKCRSFQSWMDGMHDHGLYQRFYRLKVAGPIDHHVTVRDFRGALKELICFDSNSYLGLHLHPKVIEEVERVTREVGYGTPSAQLLCGTNDHLVALEEDLAAFHGRTHAMVFPSGFAANTGILRALLRSGDAVFRDQHAHASIHEGCRKSGAERNKVFAHNDVAYLDRLLAHATKTGIQGKLVVTDGVFSMHGELAPLPELAEVCRRHCARLMVDDAHGVGVVGRTGRGIEEHYGATGAVDILMGTLSKTLGALGGYVVGDKDLIDYLRWFAPSGLFTTTLPAPVCAGARQALKIIQEEPEHRENLLRNIAKFVPPLAEAGFTVSGMDSPIVTVFVGKQETLWQVSRDLYDAGIKAGNVIYPAVPRDGCILRFTVNARHTSEDIERAVGELIVIGRRYGLIPEAN